MKKMFAVLVALVLMVSCTAALADTLTMVTNATFPPYEYYDGEALVGIDVDIATAIAAKMGCELKIVDMDFDGLVPAVAAGKADFTMAGMTVTDERKVNVDFSDSYATGIQAVIVKEDSEIASPDDLKKEGANVKVGVQLSTTGDLYATTDIQDAGFGTVVQFPSGTEAVLALMNGKVDCVLIDQEPAKAYVAANKGLKVLDTAYAQEDYAAAFAKNSPLLASFNEALQALKNDGTMDAIIAKYIPAE